MLASFACNHNYSRGRLYPESGSLLKLSPFVIDRLRIIESTAFRRLEHKTQVFISNKGDHYRNRLTHSLEVAQIARIICEALNISSDLAENIALAHDIGHCAFGHSGEDALNELMQEYDLEFDHNAHAIKILTEIETRHLKFNGLNLTWETLEGIVKHNGPLKNLHSSNAILQYNNQQSNLDLLKYSSLEAQVAAISDDIAYNNHDIDDGFRSGLLKFEELREIKKLREIIDEVRKSYPQINEYRVIHEAVENIRSEMIIDLIKNTKLNIKNFSIKTCDDVKNHNATLACFSHEMEKYHQEIKSFLYERVYNSPTLTMERESGKNIIYKLFNRYIKNPDILPTQWQEKIKSNNQKEIALVVRDFIACMSDKYAIEAYNLI